MRKFTEMDRARTVAGIAGGQTIDRRSGVRISKDMAQFGHAIAESAQSMKVLKEMSGEEASRLKVPPPPGLDSDAPINKDLLRNMAGAVANKLESSDVTSDEAFSKAAAIIREGALQTRVKIIGEYYGYEESQLKCQPPTGDCGARLVRDGKDGDEDQKG